MSRIGNKSIPIPSGVNVTLSDRTVTVQGDKGTLTYEHRPEVSVTIEDDPKTVEVKRQDDQKRTKAFHGLTRALIANMIGGVSKGFDRKLQINGVGWSVRSQGRKLVLNIGYADPRELEIPMGLEVKLDGQNMTILGADKQAVGQFAAEIRHQRPPEPYNGKGIKYDDEIIIRKEGKAFAGGGG
jgi:large subunit ribosomal protein L6